MGQLESGFSLPHCLIAPLPHYTPQMKLSYEEFDLSGIKTYPLSSRTSKVRHEDLGRAWDPASGMRGWLEALPNFLAAADFRAVVHAMLEAQAGDRGLVWGLGAHVL